MLKSFIDKKIKIKTYQAEEPWTCTLKEIIEDPDDSFWLKLEFDESKNCVYLSLSDVSYFEVKEPKKLKVIQ